jgi:hypothetical protein
VRQKYHPPTARIAQALDELLDMVAAPRASHAISVLNRSVGGRLRVRRDPRPSMG